MKNKFILFMVITVLLVTGCSCSIKPKKDENIEYNVGDSIIVTEEGVVGEQNLNGLSLENINFSVQEGITSVVTKVTNNTTEPFNLINYQMIIKDANGQVLTILTSSANVTLAPAEEQTYTTTFMLDLSSASNVEYAVNVAE